MSAATTTPTQLPPLRVLAVEDNLISQKLVTALLERSGHVVTVADNGREAVRIVDSQRFDLILMDVQMPEMDGLEATRVIRGREEKTGTHVPIVALTAGSDRQACLAAGMDEFIPKPIRAMELAAAIKRVASPRQPEEQSPAGEVLRILFIEDSQTFMQLEETYLGEGLPEPFVLERRECLSSGLERLREGSLDLLLLDLDLPEGNGLGTFLEIHKTAAGIPIVILSAQRDETLAVTATRRGAEDFLVKGTFDEITLRRSLRLAVERANRRNVERVVERTTEQLHVAHAIQQELLPKDSPDIPGLDIFGRCEPAENIGGDYFDYIPMLDGRLGIAVCDVGGHGVRSAFLMEALRAALRSLASVHRDVGDVVTCVNRVLADDSRDGEFIALTYVCYDPRSRQLTYVAAGRHCYLLDGRGEIKYVLRSDAPPVHVRSDYSYTASPPLAIEPGDLLLQFTDGVTENASADGQALGSERLLDVVRMHRDKPARNIAEMIFRSLQGILQGRQPSDDATAVVAKFSRP